MFCCTVCLCPQHRLCSTDWGTNTSPGDTAAVPEFIKQLTSFAIKALDFLLPPLTLSPLSPTARNVLALEIQALWESFNEGWRLQRSWVLPNHLPSWGQSRDVLSLGSCVLIYLVQVPPIAHQHLQLVSALLSEGV